jgi:hypothetical protein
MSLLVPAFFLLLAWFTAEYFPPWGSWHNEIGAFACGVWLFGGLLLRQGASGYRPLLLPRSAWPLVLLTLVVVLQAIAGRIVFFGDAFDLVIYLTLGIFVMAAGHAFGRQEEGYEAVQAQLSTRVSSFAVLIVIGGLGSVFIALAQALDIWGGAAWIVRMPALRRPGANLAQPNQLATLILFSIASLVYLFESRRLRGLTASMIAVTLLSGLVITESRTGVLSLFLLAGWWMLKRYRYSSKLPARSVVLFLAFFVTCFWFWPMFINFFNVEGGESAISQVNMQAGTRLVVWPQLWQAALLRPWLGWGLGGVSAAHNAILDGYGISEPFTYAHNVVLDLAVGVGLPLTALLVTVTSVWVWRRGRAANDLSSWYCLALALPFGMHSMLEFPFAYAYLLVPVLFLLGALEAQRASIDVIRIPWRIAVGCWVIVSTAMVWSAIEYILIEEDFRVARFEAMNIGQTASEYERPKIYILSQLNALSDVARIVPSPNMTSDRIDLTRKVAMRFPGSATQNRYALSLALNGNPEEAIRQLKVMRAMHGERTYQSIKANWSALAESKYPQLRSLALP